MTRRDRAADQSAERMLDELETLAGNVAISGGRNRDTVLAMLNDTVHSLRLLAKAHHPDNGYLQEQLTQVQWLAEGLAGRRMIPNTPRERILPQLRTGLESLRSSECFDVYG